VREGVSRWLGGQTDRDDDEQQEEEKICPLPGFKS